ncbi:MAG: DUF2110 family protein [Candidatus Bathyarchaeota archaeon]|nr:DUF2110 family protein [Candidatus Bathyarchaeota archaeon]
MTDIALLTRIYNTHQLKQLSQVFSGMFDELDVTVTIKGTVNSKWVLLSLEGEDEQIAQNLLDREAGTCPGKVENLKKFSIQKGYVTPIKDKADLFVDIGVFEPKTVLAKISLKHLQKHLTNGEELPLQKIAAQWGITENLPLQLKILNADPQENTVEAELAPKQIIQYHNWRDSLLDRLIILGASKTQIDIAVEQEYLNRDIINTESLGLFEHALVCKLGTDAAGIIGRIGKRLRKAKFAVYNPKKLQLTPQ